MHLPALALIERDVSTPSRSARFSSPTDKAMKAVVLSARGTVNVEEVPPPQVSAGRVLIRNEYSVLSAGTERSTVENAQETLLAKAWSRPQESKELLKSIYELGPRRTYQMVADRVSGVTMLGYSSAGVVLDVGEGVDDELPGILVAAGGQGYASHAEIVSVPKNLCAPVPPGVPSRSAAFATIGAVALHGIHRAQVEPGSRVAVVGLGLLGQLSVRILDRYGYDVVGIDRDPRMLELTREAGIPCVARQEDEISRLVRQGWSGSGADAVLITAATDSPDPVRLAGELARDRATVVIVGAVGVVPPRSSYYGKELSIRYSRSYGPGRYDPVYEELGIAYPEGYVAWPERRNLDEFLRLLSMGLDLEALQPVVFPVDEAPSAYELLAAAGDERRVAILLRHGDHAEQGAGPSWVKLPGSRWKRGRAGIRIAAVGAGSFPTRMLFPHLAREPGIRFSWITSRGGLTAVHQGRRWGFDEAVGSIDEGLARDDADCVMVLSRHDSHAAYAAQVLARGVGLFCEKPLALTEEELESVADAWMAGGTPAMVGFNRRFAPALRELKRVLEGRSPLQLSYRVFAGALPDDHWYWDLHQGGRTLGEVCHFVDTAAFLLDQVPRWVTASSSDGCADPIRAQSVSVQIGYQDGSTASLVYAGRTPAGPPKEFLEVAGDGLAAQMDDFKSLTVWRRTKEEHAFRGETKGHAEEMKALVRMVRGEARCESEFVRSLWTTLLTCRTADAIAQGRRLPVEPTTPALRKALQFSLTP